MNGDRFHRMPASGYCARVLSFPLRGNGLCKPLDSGLRRNDGAFCLLPRLLFLCCLFHARPVIIPAKAGIHAHHLGRLFQTRLYHGSAELAERPASMQAYTPVGGLSLE